MRGERQSQLASSAEIKPGVHDEVDTFCLEYFEVREERRYAGASLGDCTTDSDYAVQTSLIPEHIANIQRFLAARLIDVVINLDVVVIDRDNCRHGTEVRFPDKTKGGRVSFFRCRASFRVCAVEDIGLARDDVRHGADLRRQHARRYAAVEQFAARCWRIRITDRARIKCRIVQSRCDRTEQLANIRYAHGLLLHRTDAEARNDFPTGANLP